MKIEKSVFNETEKIFVLQSRLWTILWRGRAATIILANKNNYYQQYNNYYNNFYGGTTI
jgi:hypothetical protein